MDDMYFRTLSFVHETDMFVIRQEMMQSWVMGTVDDGIKAVSRYLVNANRIQSLKQRVYTYWMGSECVNNIIRS